MTAVRSPAPSSLRLVVGLGNSGQGYARSRHNIGFMAVEHLARRHSIPITRRRPWAVMGEGEVAVHDVTFRVLVAKPRRFMNESGDTVRELVTRYHIDLQHLIVVYDDLDLPLGKIRLRERGSSGGHRGIASIIERLGTEEFPRFRMGVGRPEEAGSEAVEYVLGDFTPAERKIVEAAIATASEALDWALAKGVASAMNKYNYNAG